MQIKEVRGISFFKSNLFIVTIILLEKRIYFLKLTIVRKKILLFALISSTLFLSCKKETSNSPDPASRVKTYTEEYTSGSTHVTGTFNLNYDNDGRLISMISTSSQGDRFQYNYLNGGATVDIFNSNTLSVHEKFLLNSDSKLDSTFQYNDTQDTTTEKYIYNSNKQLIKMINYVYSGGSSAVDDVTTYTYDASGDAVKEQDYYSQTTCEYYTDLSNSLSLGLDFLPFNSKKLVKTTTISDGYSTQVLNHTYTFDSDKRLTGEKIITDTGDIAIKTYTY